MDCAQFQAPAYFDQRCAAAPMMASDALAYLSRTQTRGCKRKHESGLQETSPLPSAFAVPNAQAFDTMSYAHGCAANRSASMDSEASSYSPLQKRHCLYPSQAPDTPDAPAAEQWQQPQQRDSRQQSVQISTFSDAQKLYALKAMLQQSCGRQTAAVVAYLQQLQRLRHATACHISQARHVQQPSEHNGFVAQARKIVKVRQHQQQISHHMVCQQHHLASRLSHQHTEAPESNRGALDSFMHQLLDTQIPAQNPESHSDAVRQLQSESHWQNRSMPEPGSVPYAPPQIQAHQQLHQSADQSHHQHQLDQSEQLWQTMLRSAQGSSASEVHSSHASINYPASHLLHMQQQARMLQQLAHVKRAHMQHHIVQEPQASVQRQLPMGAASRPALGFADLVTYWAKGLGLQRCESVQLACHLWSRVQQQVSIAYMHLLGAKRPWETMLLGCLWLAAKLEECRRGVPTASKVGALVGVERGVMGGVELYLMQLVNWAPLLDWKDRPLQIEDDTWY